MTAELNAWESAVLFRLYHGDSLAVWKSPDDLQSRAGAIVSLNDRGLLNGTQLTIAGCHAFDRIRIGPAIDRYAKLLATVKALIDTDPGGFSEETNDIIDRISDAYDELTLESGGKP